MQMKRWAETVYLISADGRLKIGFTTDLARRLAEYRSYIPNIQLVATIGGDRKVENALHRELAEFRLEREWFRDVPEVRKLFETVKREGRGYLSIQKTKSRVRERPMAESRCDYSWEEIAERYKQINVEVTIGIDIVQEWINRGRRPGPGILSLDACEKILNLLAKSYDEFCPHYLTGACNPTDARSLAAARRDITSFESKVAAIKSLDLFPAILSA